MAFFPLLMITCFFSGSFFSLDVHMFASYDRLVKISSALLMSSRFYLFVGDGGFELRPCPSREDLREELDKSGFDYYNVEGDDGGDYVEDHVDGDDAYMQKAGDTCDISPQFFLDFPQNFRLRTRNQYCAQAIA